MQRHALETLLGAVVLGIALYFLFFLQQTTQISDSKSYTIYAKFNRVDGLHIGHDIKLGGIKIGTVSNQEIEPDTFMAKISMRIHNYVKLPIDSSARVIADGLLGDAFIDIQPGGADDNIPDKGYINYTQDAVNLVDLLGRFVFSVTESGGKK